MNGTYRSINFNRARMAPPQMQVPGGTMRQGVIPAPTMRQALMQQSGPTQSVAQILSEPLGEPMPNLGAASSDAARQRQIADMLLQGAMAQDNTSIAGGISQLGQAFLARRAGQKADTAEDRQREMTQLLMQQAMGGGDQGKASLEQLLMTNPDAAMQYMAQQYAPPEQPEAYTLAPGQRRFVGDQMVAEVPEAPEAPLERWEQIEAPPGMPGFYERSTLTGQTRRVSGPASAGITIGPDGSVQIGGPVSGLGYGTASKGQEAAIAFDREGNPVVTPGPQQEQYNKAIRGLGEFQAQNAIVIEDIDRALSGISGWSTGAGAALKDLPIVGGITPAGQMESLLSTIQSNVGFDKLQAMREASPTGGALGSVTEKELAFLQSVFGSLRQDTSPENVRYNLTRLKSHMQGREQRLEEAIAADFPSLQQTAERRAGANQQVQDLNDLLQFMTPEERALFEGAQ